MSTHHQSSPRTTASRRSTTQTATTTAPTTASSRPKEFLQRVDSETKRRHQHQRAAPGGKQHHHHSHHQPPATKSRKMGASLQHDNTSAQELLYLTGQAEATLPAWMVATIIEDDDLQFGGKNLSTWYEEDRRRYSLGEESCPSSPGSDSGAEAEMDRQMMKEEERRGRQRDRPDYRKHTHRKPKEEKRQ